MCVQWNMYTPKKLLKKTYQATKNATRRAGEMAHWSKALVVFPGDSGLIPSTQMSAHNRP